MRVKILEIDTQDAYFEYSEHLVGIVGEFNEWAMWSDNEYSYGEFYLDVDIPNTPLTILNSPLIFFGIKVEAVKEDK